MPMTTDSADTKIAQQPAETGFHLNIPDAATHDLSSPKDTVVCDTFNGCGDAGCYFPIDWQSAQTASAWCGLYQANPRTTLSLCRNPDGYNLATVTYFIGGEMMITIHLDFFYDPVTGAYVQDQLYNWPEFLTSCLVVPNGPLLLRASCEGPATGLQLTCPTDAGRG
jgi:hypothetical protein